MSARNHLPNKRRAETIAFDGNEAQAGDDGAGE
jgi:hypothetical protein